MEKEPGMRGQRKFWKDHFFLTRGDFFEDHFKERGFLGVTGKTNRGEFLE